MIKKRVYKKCYKTCLLMQQSEFTPINHEKRVQKKTLKVVYSVKKIKFPLKKREFFISHFNGTILVFLERNMQSYFGFHDY